MTRPLLAPLAAALASVAVAGCGGSGGDPDADPAAVVPARAPVYLEATLDPEGDTSEDVRALSRRLGGTDDPGGRLIALLERAADEGGGDFRWKRDVAPWIGDRVGLFVSSVSATGAKADGEAALVAPTDDPDAAEEALERQLGRRDPDRPPPRLSDRTHREVEYRVDAASGTAVAIVEDYAVIGNERAVRAAIDAAAGEALADSEGFGDARDQVEDERIGFGYARVSALLSGLGPQGLALRQVLGGMGETIAFAVDPEADALRVESAALGAREAPAGDPGDVLAGLPGDAWLAAGTSDIRARLERSLRQVGQLGAFGGFDLEQVLAQVRRQTGIDVRRDLIRWMGDGGIFVRGTAVSDLGGALVVRSSDPAATARVVPRLGRVVARSAPGARVAPLRRAGVDAGVTLRFAALPLPIHLVAADDRFVLAVTDGALDAALDPARPLGESRAFRDAGARLGDGVRPSLFMDLGPVGELVDGTGAVQGREAEEARRVLERLTTIAAGARRDGDVQRGRFVVGVR